MTAAIDVPLIPTSSQTVGPFVEIGCKYLESDRVVARAPDMVDVVVRGRVIDGDGKIVPDFMLEIWQAITPGSAVIADSSAVIAGAPAVILSEAKDRSPAKAVGFARVMPTGDGSFVFHTAYESANHDTPAPYLAILVFMRGLLKPVLTRMYFPDDPRTAADPVLAVVPADRRATLIAKPVSSPTPDAQSQLEWNVVLQGPGETVFFEW